MRLKSFFNRYILILLKKQSYFLISLTLIFSMFVNTVFAATPTISGISPNNGLIAGGTAVTISGTNFSNTNDATGGTITYTDSSGLNPRSSPYAGGYTVHKFTGNGTFVVPSNRNVSVLVVAGGGGGGNYSNNNGNGGGGGAGGLLYNASLAVTAQSYTVTVGGVGNGGTGGCAYGTNGGNSVFSSLTAIGGGAGAYGCSNIIGKTGGSGGGSATNNGGSTYGGHASGTSGQGNYGGGAALWNSNNSSAGGGGGGAGAVGADGTSVTGGGAGGAGLSYSISGVATYYAGGGGGASGGAGGSGGGGAANSGVGTAGTPNTGGGGGGGNTGGAGGSGVVIIRYPTETGNVGVTVGGGNATNIVLVSSTSITATTPSHTAGATNVVVTNYGGQNVTLTNGYTYFVPSTVATVTSGTYTVSNNSILNVPGSTSKTTFLANIIKGEANQTWDTTGIADPVVALNSLVVTAEDGVTTKTYIINETPSTSAFTAICSVGGNGCTADGIAASPQSSYNIPSVTGTSALGSYSISNIQISIKDTDASVNEWYNTSNNTFDQVSENWFTVTGTTSWSYNTSAIAWVPDHIYQVRVRGTSTNGLIETPKTLSFNFQTSPPTISNVTAVQNTNGTVTIGYDSSDLVATLLNISLGLDVGATLSSGITSGSGSLIISSSSSFPATGNIYIDDEQIAYTGKTTTSLTGLIRAQNNTTATSHDSSANIYIKAVTLSGDTGAGILKGTNKTITWTASTDVVGLTTSTAKIRVIANNGNLNYQVGSNLSNNFSLDTTPPGTVQVSSVVGKPSGPTTAVITWTTDKPSSSEVNYGGTVSYGSTVTDSEMVTEHSINLTGLTASSPYYFRVKSVDATSNNFIDDNSGNGYVFSTVPKGNTSSSICNISSPDSTPPYINSVTVTDITDSSFKVSWTTDEDASSLVYFGESVSYGLIIGEPDIFKMEHGVIVAELKSGTTYNIKIVSMDKFGNKGVSDNKVVITTGEGSGTGTSSGSSSPNQIQIDALEQQINTLLAQKTSLQTQIVDLQNQISALDSSDPSLSGLQSQLDALQIQYTGISTSLSQAETDLATLQASSVIGSDTTVLTNQINNLQNQKAINEKSIIDLEKQLAGGLTGSDAEAVQAQILSLRSELNSTNSRLQQAENTLNQLKGLQDQLDQKEKRITGLESSLDYITDKVLGIKKGDALSPSDLLKIVSTKFQQLAQLFKSKATVQEKQNLENTLSDTAATLKDLTDLIPGPKIITTPNIKVNSTDAVVNWTTDKSSTGMVAYSNEAFFKDGKYLSQAGDPNKSEINHAVSMIGLIPSTNYHYQILSKSDSGAETNSDDFVFTTKTEIPIITNPKILKISDNSMQISWQTNIPTNSVVAYTPVIKGVSDTANSKSQGLPEYTKNHSVKIIDLKAGTIYSVDISSTDGFNNVVTHKLGNLTTGQDKIAPIITELRPTISIIPNANQITIQAIITWKTDEVATTQIIWDKGSDENKLLSKTNSNGEFTYNHTAVITNWDQNSLYSFKAISKDQSGNEASSKVYTIRTPEQKGTIVDVIIGNFMDIFGWTKNLTK